MRRRPGLDSVGPIRGAQASVGCRRCEVPLPPVLWRGETAPARIQTAATVAGGASAERASPPRALGRAVGRGPPQRKKQADVNARATKLWLFHAPGSGWAATGSACSVLPELLQSNLE